MTVPFVEPMRDGHPALTPFQQDVLLECLRKNSGALALPMGAGKTVLALTLAQLQSGGTPFVWVCAKSLLGNLQVEIRKFFGDRLPYLLLYGPARGDMRLAPATRLVITTPEVAARAFTALHLPEQCIVEERAGRVVIHHFRWSNDPWMPVDATVAGPNMLYHTRWGAVVIDEAQEHSNSTSRKCHALGAICSAHRWLLSGTMFNEPDATHMLGIWLLLNQMTPRSVPEMRLHMQADFRGLRQLQVHRATNPDFKRPRYEEHIVAHDLTVHEQAVYRSFRDVLELLNNRVKQMREVNDTEQARIFSTYQLTMVTHLRQALVSPMVPITSAAIGMADYRQRKELSSIFMRHLNMQNLLGWLQNPDAMRSSRVDAVLGLLVKHTGARIVVFGCFDSCLTVIAHYARLTGHRVLTMRGNTSMQARVNTLLEFEHATDGAVLIMSYQLGAEGLNLQCASVAILVDFWWNAGRTSQAIARLMRMGQCNPCVYAYLLTANTGIERAIFGKQVAKLERQAELMEGPTNVRVPVVRLQDVIEIILRSDNEEKLREVRARA